MVQKSFSLPQAVIEALADDGITSRYSPVKKQVEEDLQRGWDICPLAYDGCRGCKEDWRFEEFCSNGHESKLCLYQELLIKRLVIAEIREGLI